MDRLLIWVALAGVYGAVLALLYNTMGRWGILVWLVIVTGVQLWLRRRANEG